eukprot:g4698.t1
MSSMKIILSHPGVRWIGLGWTGFIAENVIVSHNRDYIISSFGNNVYHGAYNCLSTAACASIAYGYYRYGRGSNVPQMWTGRGSSFQRAGAVVLQAAGLIGFSQLFPRLQVPVELINGNETQSVEVQENVQKPTTESKGPSSIKWAAKCPFDFSDRSIPDDAIYGTKRITRHPGLWSLGFLGLGTALVTSNAPGFVLCSFPLAFALIGGAHQDYRYRRGSGGVLLPEVDEISSNIPFLALVSGKQPNGWSRLRDEMKWTNAGVAVALSLLLLLRRRRLRIK